MSPTQISDTALTIFRIMLLLTSKYIPGEINNCQLNRVFKNQPLKTLFVKFFVKVSGKTLIFGC